MIYAISGALPMASAILLLPAYVYYLELNVYSQLAIYTAMMFFAQVLISIGLDQTLYLYYETFKRNSQLIGFIGAAFLAMATIATLVLIIFALVAPKIQELCFGDVPTPIYVCGSLITCTAFLQAVQKLNNALLQIQQKAASYLAINLCFFLVLASLTLGGLVLFPNNVVVPIAARAATALLVVLWVAVSYLRRYSFQISLATLYGTMSFARPMWIYQIIQSVNNYYDRIFMTSFVPLEQVGIYDFVSKCLLSIEYVISGAYNAFWPKVLKIADRQTQKYATVEINRYYHGLTAIAILLVATAIAFGPPMITVAADWLNKPAYKEAAQWVPILALTYIFRAIRFYAAMPYGILKYVKPLPLIYTFVVAVKIAAMIFCIPRWGIAGIAYSIWIGYGVESFLLYYVVRKQFRFKANLQKLFIAPGLFLIIVGAAEYFWDAGAMLKRFLYIPLAIALLLWAYRRELKYFPYVNRFGKYLL